MQDADPAPPLRDDHLHEVHAGRLDPVHAVAGGRISQGEAGRSDQPPQTARVHAAARSPQRVETRLERSPRKAAGLDLDAREHAAPARQEIQLAAGRLEPAGQDAPARGPQVSRRELLADPPQLVPVRDAEAQEETRGAGAQPRAQPRAQTAP